MINRSNDRIRSIDRFLHRVPYYVQDDPVIFEESIVMTSDIDNDKLGALVGKMLGDLGGAFSVPTARIGFRLGLFEALHSQGAARVSELAARAGLAERYVREWAFAQAANGYINFDAKREQFSLTPEQAMVFAVKDSPVYLEGAFDLASAMIEGQPKVEAAFRNGQGVAWGDSGGWLVLAVGALLPPRYLNNHPQSWLPPLGRLPAKPED